ncbi:YIR protein [Plasmodium yoelii]|uniref:YIR protein n=1 Tax=Plasmodium yoelii TaxID=5861 RepID=A0A077YDZ8_PLAYE|nr:YIR protein [Plasmodium yoelii]
MDARLCRRFGHLINYLPDELGTSPSLKFNTLGKVMNYCSNGESKGAECKTDIDQIKAGFIWLFEQNIVSRISNLSKDQPKVFIVYITIWLSYMLNLKGVTEFKNMNEIYTKHIENNMHHINCKKTDNDCNNSLKEKTEYNSFNELIESNKCLMKFDINDMSKFYNGFKSLCKMHIECNVNKSKCTECLQIAEEFVKKYEKLNEDPNNIDNSSYSQMLSTLSADYDNFKKKYDDAQNCKSSPLPTIEKKKIIVKDFEQIPEKTPEKTPEQSYEVTSSSSSISKNLFIVLSIFGAIGFFLGISYKYSLFGFRKRDQKHLRGKLKKKEENGSLIYDSKINSD